MTEGFGQVTLLRTYINPTLSFGLKILTKHKGENEGWLSVARKLNFGEEEKMRLRGVKAVLYRLDNKPRPRMLQKLI